MIFRLVHQHGWKDRFRSKTLKIPLSNPISQMARTTSVCSETMVRVNYAQDLQWSKICLQTFLPPHAIWLFVASKQLSDALWAIPTVHTVLFGTNSTDGKSDASAKLKQIRIRISNSPCAYVALWYYSDPGTAYTNLRSGYHNVLQY